MATVQIEIPDELLMKDGVRYEPTGEFRLCKKGECYLGNGTPLTVCEAQCDSTYTHFFILRPVWTWPEWLGGAAIAMNDDGFACWHEKEPMKNKRGNWVSSGHVVTLDFLLGICHFTLPTLKPGEIVHNPRYEEGK